MEFEGMEEWKCSMCGNHFMVSIVQLNAQIEEEVWCPICYSGGTDPAVPNCNECESISLVENKQIHKSENHICLKYGRRVFHRDNHIGKISGRMIHPCKECNDGFIGRRGKGE